MKMFTSICLNSSVFWILHIKVVPSAGSGTRHQVVVASVHVPLPDAYPVGMSAVLLMALAFSVEHVNSSRKYFSQLVYNFSNKCFTVEKTADIERNFDFQRARPRSFPAGSTAQGVAKAVCTPTSSSRPVIMNKIKTCTWFTLRWMF